MSDILVYLGFNAVFLLITAGIIIFFFYKVQEAMFLQQKTYLDGKLQTLPATLTKVLASAGGVVSDREPSNMEIMLGFVQAVVAAKQQGWSIGDIVNEFGGLLGGELKQQAKQVLGQTETPED